MVSRSMMALLLMCGGFVGHRLGWLPRRELWLRVVFYVTLPLTILRSLLKVPLPETMWLLGGLGFLVSLGTGVLAGVASLFFKMEWRSRSVFLAAPTVANLGFFLYPFVVRRFGDQGLVSLLSYDLGNTLFAYTATAAVTQMGLSRRGTYLSNLLQVFRSPPLWALALGVLGNKILNIRRSFFPLEIGNSINFVLVMVALGMYVEPRIQAKALPSAIGIVLVRMLGGVMICYALTSIVNVGEARRVIVLLASGMPVGIVSLIYAEREGLDVELASEAISMSLVIGIIAVILLDLLRP